MQNKEVNVSNKDITYQQCFVFIRKKKFQALYCLDNLLICKQIIFLMAYTFLVNRIAFKFYIYSENNAL